jgi:hypothetical protein
MLTMRRFTALPHSGCSADSGPYPGDQDYFHGDATELTKYAFFVLLFFPVIATDGADAFVYRMASG